MSLFSRFFGSNPDAGDEFGTFSESSDESKINMDDIKGMLFSDPTKQFVKGIGTAALNTAVPMLDVDFKQTNDNFEPEVVDAIRTATVRALEAGRKGTDYEDYDDLPDGTPMGEFVRSADARGGAANFMKQVTASPAAKAAFSVGRGSIRVDDDGSVYFTDKYNFSGSSSNKGKDVYSAGRSLAGRLMQEDEGDTTGNTIEIYLGKKDDLMGREIKKGDTLGKIAKEMGVTVTELAAFNGIADPNKIKVGQRIRKPKKVEEEVVSLEPDDDLFGGVI